ncbi:peptidylprolyl isomerase [Patescibacteria group bacterium]|nr:peptidylprolyl isomerase [Patescibacteria group bacterium]
MLKYIIISLACLLIIGGLIYAKWGGNKNQITEAEKTAAPQASQEKTLPPPPLTIDAEKNYTAKLKTSEGEIVIKLNAKETPLTVNNFIYLAKNNFYDGVIFHRVIKDFMIQSGDPKGDGTGGPGYRFADEPFSGEYSRGAVAMANAGPNTNGSQFFIMHADRPLPKNYVIFGEVASGMDAVDKIAETLVELSATSEMSKPVLPIIIESVEIVEE